MAKERFSQQTKIDVKEFVGRVKELYAVEAVVLFKQDIPDREYEIIDIAIISPDFNNSGVDHWAVLMSISNKQMCEGKAVFEFSPTAVLPSEYLKGTKGDYFYIHQTGRLIYGDEKYKPQIY